MYNNLLEENTSELSASLGSVTRTPAFVYIETKFCTRHAHNSGLIYAPKRPRVPAAYSPRTRLERRSLFFNMYLHFKACLHYITKNRVFISQEMKGSDQVCRRASRHSQRIIIFLKFVYTLDKGNAKSEV
jgi:hypothetical protein